MNQTLAQLLYGVLSRLLTFLLQIIDYLEQQVLSESSDELRDLWVRDGELLPIHEGCFAPFRAQGKLHPAQLSGWELASYMSCLVEINEDIRSDFCQDPHGWNQYMMQYLPDLNQSSELTNFDPFDPNVIPGYTTGITQSDLSLGPGNFPFNQTYCLPFLSATYITARNEGRLALAEATLALWYALGINQTPEDLIVWVAMQESDFQSSENIQHFIELVHYTYYHVTGEDPVLFLAMWSVGLFNQENDQNSNPSVNVEFRDSDFLTSILNPVLIENADISYLDFNEGSMGNYIYFNEGETGEAYRTFGLTEAQGNRFSSDSMDFNNVNNDSSARGLLWEDYIGDDDIGIYVMTREQLNCARAITTNALTLTQVIDLLRIGCDCTTECEERDTEQ